MANQSNLKKFSKGQSGNPAGRPKGAQNVKTRLNRILGAVIKTENPFTGLEEELTVAERMDIEIIKKALEGDVSAYREVMNRLEGKPGQQTDLNIKAETTIATLTAEQIKMVNAEFKKEFM